MSAWASLLAVAACSGDPTEPSGTAGGGGSGDTTAATADVAAPVAVSASSSSSGITTVVSVGGGGDGGAGGPGGGGSGGQGAGGDGAVCTDEPLPGAGGADGAGGAQCEPGAPEDCSTPEAEACTRRSLCGPGIAFPIARGGDVVFGTIDRRIGTVDRDLHWSPIGEAVDTIFIGTDPLGSAYVVTESTVELRRLAGDGEILFARPIAYHPLRAQGDAEGNVVLLHGVAPLVAGEPVTGQGRDALHRLSPTGSHLWSRKYGVLVSGIDFEFRGFAVDAAGDVVVSGSYDGEVEFGSEPLPTGWYGFVARFDGTTGDVEWVTVLPEGEEATGELVFTPDGSIILVGAAVDLETYDRSGVITRFDADGAIVWRREMRGDESHAVYLFAAVLGEEEDAAFFSGEVRGAVSLDGLVAGRDGYDSDPLFGSVDLEGNALALRSFDTRPLGKRFSGDSSAYDVLPMCGRVLVSGLISGSTAVDVGPNELQNQKAPGQHERYSVEVPLER